MNYIEKIEELLKENMTEKGFHFWKAINGKLPDIWSRPTSSTGKYHLKEGGRVPSCDEHVYGMLFAASKILKMFKIIKNTSDADMILLSIVLHDGLKFGDNGDMRYTSKVHDRAIADKIKNAKEAFLNILNEEQIILLEEAVRFHSGQWSADADSDFEMNKVGQYAQFVHTLDMLETANVIKY